MNTLNEAVVASGAPLEGNLFYYHHSSDFLHSQPHPGRVHKRRNYFHAVRFKKSLLELGFNAGHSALLALSCNPGLRFVGVDIAQNKYTLKCAEIVRQLFPERFELIVGDSRNVLPYIATHRRELKFDLLHVDGGHGVETCRTDISNCVRIAENSGGRPHLIVDDTAHMPILDVFREFVSLGYLVTETMAHQWEQSENLLAIINI